MQQSERIKEPKGAGAETLSRILTGVANNNNNMSSGINTSTPNSGLAILQRAAVAASLANSNQEQTSKTLQTSQTPTSTITSSRIALPLLQGQNNGQLLMLMNQNDLVRLAQESALHHALGFNSRSSDQDGVDEEGKEEPSQQDVLGVSSSDRATRRKSVHNEVEKRRRQKINTWIEKLAQVVPPAPGTSQEQQQQQPLNTSNLSCKADVLQRTYDYVIELAAAQHELNHIINVIISN